MILYRGINEEMFVKSKGRLQAKGNEDKAELFPSEHLYPKETHIPGKNMVNAINKHQDPNRFNEDGFKDKSAYISTSRLYEIAVQYATYSGSKQGYVFFLDKSILESEGFIIVSINARIDSPTNPTDHEYVIRMRFSDDYIPQKAILKIVKVSPNDK